MPTIPTSLKISFSVLEISPFEKSKCRPYPTESFSVSFENWLQAEKTVSVTGYKERVSPFQFSLLRFFDIHLVKCLPEYL